MDKLIWTLLEIYLPLQQRKNSANRPRIDTVILMVRMAHFFWLAVYIGIFFRIAHVTQRNEHTATMTVPLYDLHFDVQCNICLGLINTMVATLCADHFKKVRSHNWEWKFQVLGVGTFARGSQLTGSEKAVISQKLFLSLHYLCLYCYRHRSDVENRLRSSPRHQSELSAVKAIMD